MTIPIRKMTCACGAVEETRSPTWKRCRKCAAKLKREKTLARWHEVRKHRKKKCVTCGGEMPYYIRSDTCTACRETARKESKLASRDERICPFENTRTGKRKGDCQEVEACQMALKTGAPLPCKPLSACGYWSLLAEMQVEGRGVPLSTCAD